MATPRGYRLRVDTLSYGGIVTVLRGRLVQKMGGPERQWSVRLSAASWLGPVDLPRNW